MTLRTRLTQDIADAVFYTVFEMNQKNLAFTEEERYHTINSLLFDKNYFPHEFFKKGWIGLLRSLLDYLKIKPYVVDINPDFAVYSFLEIAESQVQYQEEFMRSIGTINHIGTSTGGKFFEIPDDASYELKYSPGYHTPYGPMKAAVSFIETIFDTGESHEESSHFYDDFIKTAPLILHNLKEPDKSRRRDPSKNS